MKAPGPPLLLLVLAASFGSAQEEASTSSSLSDLDASPTTAPSPRRVVAEVEVDCKSSLLPGQFVCEELVVDEATQQPSGCVRETNLAPGALLCSAAPGFVCLETGNATFSRDVPCLWTNGYDFETTLLLSVFLGMFGADRFYLGYPALGLLKFSTLGFFFLGHLLDIMLIASQYVGPADGSHYVIR